MHPDYFSTGYAAVLAKENKDPVLSPFSIIMRILYLPWLKMVLMRKLSASAWTGPDYGTDGNTWGGEFLIADTSDFKRYTHFDYIAMPGGDKVVEEPWRMALSYLYKYFGDTIDYDSLPVFRSVGRQKLTLVKEMIR